MSLVRLVPNSGEMNKLQAFSFSAKARKVFKASDENSGCDQAQVVTKYAQESVLSIGAIEMPSEKYLFHPQIEILTGFNKGSNLFLWK